MITALVTAVHKQRYELLLQGETCFARLKQSAYHDGAQPYPTTGDWVRVQPNPDGDSVIHETMPRKSFFSRLDPDKSRLHEQVVAANFDHVFILMSLNQNFNLHRLERYLTLAWESGGMPVIVLTKADLADDCSTQIAAVQGISAGVPVHAVSSVTGQGLDDLAQYLSPGAVSVFLGSSGVGKSSLLNALAGTTRMAVSAIRADDDKGRHTTTHRQLVVLPGGAMVIDTPGMRELGLWTAESGLGEAFSDVERYMGNCKFTDCGHTGEPGCAIATAIASGALTQARLDHYLKLQREAHYIEHKAVYLREKEARIKMYEKINRLRQKDGTRQKF